jgi:hypothetical protein
LVALPLHWLFLDGSKVNIGEILLFADYYTPMFGVGIDVGLGPIADILVDCPKMVFLNI